jgi:Cof subfamily protein (haloacid dehalogenase superfamily)
VKPDLRLLAVDIDGTLLNSEYRIPDANLEALRRARQAGVEIVLVTGRRHTFALPIVEMLGFGVCLISSNGAVTRLASGDLFHRDLLPAAAARRLCAHMDEFRGHIVVTFDAERKGALVLEGLEHMTPSITRWLEKNMEFIEFVRPIEQALTSDPIQVMYCGGIVRMQAALGRLAHDAVNGDFTVLRTEYPARDLCIVDVLNRGCTKGRAVARWARHRGLAPEQVMAIGDNFNDIEMLEFAGFPVIMGNASAELRQRGWPVTLSNDEAGVAAALDRYLAP